MLLLIVVVVYYASSLADGSLADINYKFLFKVVFVFLWCKDFCVHFVTFDGFKVMMENYENVLIEYRKINIT